jgi:RecJ-like exonuclease
MQPYDQERPCPKCRAVGARTEYHARSTVRGDDSGTHQSCRLMGDGETEHLHRICETCGYHWAEAPLDATPGTGSA